MDYEEGYAEKPQASGLFQLQIFTWRIEANGLG
jgi:hypothetical protein